MKEKGLFTTVDEYIALYPPSVKAGLDLLRKTIKTAAPGAEEMISYQMPAYKLKGMLAFFFSGKKTLWLLSSCQSDYCIQGKIEILRNFPRCRQIPIGQTHSR